MDRKWREHLYEMDYLQEGIGLRAMGQRDPLVEYQREGFDLFTSMMEAIKEESVGFLFNVEVQVEEAVPSSVGQPPQLDLNALVATGPGENPGEVVAEPFVPPTPMDAPDEVVSAFGTTPQAPPQPAVPPVGVAGEPVPSPAPAAFETEQSLDVERKPAGGVLPEAFGRPDRPQNLQYTAPTVDGGSGVHQSSGPMSPTAVGEGQRPGQASGGDQSRNSLCHCGSGKKYKRCHGDPRNR
jgi:preprotein translocase subunit SecA